MKTILISYDLNRPEQNYSDLIGYLKSFSTRWHHLDSFWLVKTELTAKEVRDQAWSHMDSDDELLVIDVTGDGAAWKGIAESGSKWLRENL